MNSFIISHLLELPKVCLLLTGIKVAFDQCGSLNILKTYIFVAYGGSYNPSLEFVSIEPLFVFSFVEKSLPAGLPGKGWVIIIQSCQIVQTKSVNHSKTVEAV